MAKPGPVDRIAGSTPALVLGLLANALAVGALLLSTSVRNWVEHHPMVVFWCAVGLLLSLFVVWNRYARRLAAASVEVALLAEHAATPTERDKEAFLKLLDLMPWNSGVMRFLDTRFTAKRWKSEQVEPLYRFEVDWERAYFDDQVVQEAFERFRARALDLTDWLAGEGSSDPTSDDPDVISIAAVHERGPGGLGAYDAARQAGFKAARAFVEERDRFEKAGRARGL